MALTRMQQRRGTAAEWTAANPILAAGEIGFEVDTLKFKIGNGSSVWSSLPYFLNRTDIEVGLLDTDEVSEGTINLYFTNQRAVDAVVSGDVNSDDIEEGTVNLYFTNERAIEAVGESIALTDLSDVNTTGVADGYSLVFSTSANSWVAEDVTADNLNDISDVTISDPVNGESLIYSSGNWINQEIITGIDDITETTTSRTLALTDTADLIRVNSTSSVTITVPLDSSVAFPIKTVINVVKVNSGDVLFDAEIGVSINSTPGLKLRDQWSAATLIKINTNEWLIVGDLSE